ncbi:hypothetical protein BDK51DRAFT_32977, partial [Blyttiomyces helicus]
MICGSLDKDVNQDTGVAFTEIGAFGRMGPECVRLFRVSGVEERGFKDEAERGDVLGVQRRGREVQSAAPWADELEDPARGGDERRGNGLGAFCSPHRTCGFVYRRQCPVGEKVYGEIDDVENHGAQNAAYVRNLIAIAAEADRLIEGRCPETFWSAVSLLNLPITAFPTLYSLALDNCRLFLTTSPRSSAQFSGDPNFLRPLASFTAFPGIQPLLKPALLGRAGPEARDKAFDLLLTSWAVLPDYFVDPGPQALLTTVLMTLTWLFANVAEGDGGVGVATLTNLHNRARKWSKDSDLRPSSTRLTSTLLANMPLRYFAFHFPTFLSEDVAPKPKLKPHAYATILKLLRGRYHPDLRGDARRRFQKADVYRVGMRPEGEEELGVVTGRLKAVADVFLWITLKLISHLLETRNAEGSTELFYIGLRALRIIADPDSGFAKAALDRDPGIQSLLDDIPFEFEGCLVQLLQICEPHVAVTPATRAKRVVEPPVVELGEMDIGGGAAGKAVAEGAVGAEEKVENGSLLSAGELAFKSSSRHSRPNITLPRGSTAAAAFLSPSQALDDHVGATVASWLRASGVDISDVAALASKPRPDAARRPGSHSSTVKHTYLPLSRPSSPSTPSAPQSTLILRLFREIIRIVPLMPTPELVAGQYFIGAYLVHETGEIAREVSATLQRLFARYPDMRLSILNGFLNYLKTSDHHSDASLTTLLANLSRLISSWAATIPNAAPIPAQLDASIIARVSCKLDAAMLICLARPDPRVRSLALACLADFYTVSEEIAPHGEGEGELPLYAIITRGETRIARRAIHAFLETLPTGPASAAAAAGTTIAPAVAAGLTLLPYSTVAAASSAPRVWRTHLGEIASAFAALGRHKALRHAAKFLRALAFPQLARWGVQAEVNETQAGWLVLMMALAGVPDKSEVEYVVEQRSGGDNLLYKDVIGCLLKVVSSDNQAQVDAASLALYFTHVSLLQLLISDLFE